MLKYKCELEVVRNGKKYTFLSDHDSPLPEVIDILSEMRLFALNIMNDAMKKAEEAKLEKSLEELKEEAEKLSE